MTVTTTEHASGEFVLPYMNEGGLIGDCFTPHQRKKAKS